MEDSGTLINGGLRNIDGGLRNIVEDSGTQVEDSKGLRDDFMYRRTHTTSSDSGGASRIRGSYNRRNVGM